MLSVLKLHMFHQRGYCIIISPSPVQFEQKKKRNQINTKSSNNFYQKKIDIQVYLQNYKRHFIDDKLLDCNSTNLLAIAKLTRAPEQKCFVLIVTKFMC